MREILFRGKRTDGQWIYGGLLKVTYDGNTYNLIFADNFLFVFGEAKAMEHACVDPATVGQFTGLTDKNGKKIFEGDIVRCISMKNFPKLMTDMANMVVIFKDGEFRMVLCEKYKDYIPGCGFYVIRCFDKEVIGNIHDNPELLEK